MKHSQRPVAQAINRRATMTWLVAGTLTVGIALSAGHARAESNFLNSSGTATAHLDFQIVIPKILFLQVGTGTLFANNTAIDRIVFDMTATPAVIGNGTSQTATSGGDVSPGVVTAKVIGNSFTGGAVNLVASTGGAMSDGAGDTISWSEIAITTAGGATLPHPGTPNLADTGTTTVSLTPVNKVINQTGQWTFKYKNSNVPAAGTYGAVGVTPTTGRVTYTIAMP